MNKAERFAQFMMALALGIAIGGVAMTFSSDDFYTEYSKKVIGYTWSELDKLKADCEASLPRDKFCKLEIKGVEE